MENDNYYIRPPFSGVRMPLSQRAKQFAPFAALTSFGSAIEKVERECIKSDRKILSEDAMSEINNVLCSLKTGSKVTVCFYIEETYREVVGKIIHNDTISKFIRLAGGVVDDIDFSLKIPYSDIYRIQSFSKGK